MPDMLVKLYTLPPLAPLIERQRAAGIEVRRALVPEKHLVVEWVRRHFKQPWADECDVSFGREPVACFIATDGDQIVGFGCYDTTFRNFFGPTGVDETYRGRDIGRALLVACLHAMADGGFGYAIIGAAGPTEFYSKTVGAIAIEDSWPGMYRGLLRDPE